MMKFLCTFWFLFSSKVMNTAAQQYLNRVDRASYQLTGTCYNCFYQMQEEQIRQSAEENPDLDHPTHFVQCFNCKCFSVAINFIVTCWDPHSGRPTFHTFEYYSTRQLVVALRRHLQLLGRNTTDLSTLAKEDSDLLWSISYHYKGKNWLNDPQIPVLLAQ